MSLTLDPISPWHILALLLVAIMFVGVLARILRPFILRLLARRLSGATANASASTASFATATISFGRRRWVRIVNIVGTLAGAALLALAPWNPRLVQEGGGEQLHVELLLDVSESMRRDEAAWNTLQQELRRWIVAQVEALEAAGVDVKREATAGISTLGSRGATAGRVVPLSDLSIALDRLRPSDFAPGDATRLALGLEVAGGRIREEGGRGAVLLVSDGNDTDGTIDVEGQDIIPVLQAARELARDGIPVSVLAARGSRPALSLTAADLPVTVTSGAETKLRGGIANQTGQAAEAALGITMNPGVGTEPSPFGTEFASGATFDLPDEGWVAFRPALRFSGFGLQFADLTLSTAGPEPERRRFYTYVKRPARLLSLGAQGWLTALQESDLEVIQKRPSELRADMNFTEVDVIAFSEIDFRKLDRDVARAIAKASREQGVGLFFLHGPHDDPRRATLFSTILDTPLEPFLPVVPKRTDEIPEERHLILMPDTSGSMGQWMTTLQTVCTHIIRQLRPTDKLDIIAFDVQARHKMKSAVMNEANKREAIQIISRLKAAGGTDPKEALRLVGKGSYANGSLVFLSDGGFSPNSIVESVRMRPDLPCTVFAFGTARYDTLKKLAVPVKVPKNVDPSRIEIPFLGQSDKGAAYFDPELFEPLALPFLRENQRLPVPEFTTDGCLVCTPREGATFIASRMPHGYPVLATIDPGLPTAGKTASWAGPLSGEWLNSREGRNAVTTWIESLVGHAERNRYDLRVTDKGDTIRLNVSIAADETGIPDVDRLSAAVVRANGQVKGVRLDPDPVQRATFAGDIRLDRGETTERGFLVLSEIGDNALSGEQLIPFLIPPQLPVRAPGSREDWTHGLNIGLLSQITGVTGGRLNPDPLAPLLRADSAILKEIVLWPWLVFFGLCLYVVAIAVRRLAG